MKTTTAKTVKKGVVKVGELRKVFNNILTEVSNGSRKLSATVYQSNDGANTLVYEIQHQGATLVLQVAENT